jgi:hypothetical protein
MIVICYRLDWLFYTTYGPSKDPLMKVFTIKREPEFQFHQDLEFMEFGETAHFFPSLISVFFVSFT